MYRVLMIIALLGALAPWSLLAQDAAPVSETGAAESAVAGDAQNARVSADSVDSDQTDGSDPIDGSEPADGSNPAGGSEPAEGGDLADRSAELEIEERARLERLTADREALEAAAQRLQGELGIYSPQLSEVYSDLGAVYSELEEHEEAAARYNEALQIARINSGLNSAEQLPLIESMVDSFSELNDWQRVDDLRHLALHISSRVYPIEDDRFLAAAEDYGQWKLRLVQENLLGQSTRARLGTAEELSEFYEELLGDLEVRGDEVPEQRLSLLYSKTQADLAVARAVAATPYRAFQGTANPYITQTRCERVVNSQGQVVRQCYQVRVENPRYRQSQRDAKRIALSRYQREVSDSIEAMQGIRDAPDTLSAAEVARVNTQIGELEQEVRQLRRSSNRLAL